MRLTKATNASSPFPHQTLALQPALAERPPARWKANIAEKAAKLPYLSLQSSLSRKGAGTSKEKAPPVTTSSGQAKGSSCPEMGEQKLLQSLLSVSAHNALARGQPKGVSVSGLVARPLRAANEPQWGSFTSSPGQVSKLI